MMAGAKYSPGFDDPAADRRRAQRRFAGLAGLLLGALALGGVFWAYLSPSFTIDLGSFMALCGRWFGLE